MSLQSKTEAHSFPADAAGRAPGLRGAVAAGVLYCLISGAGFRALSAVLCRDDGGSGIAADLLEQTPLRLGDCADHAGLAPCWQGEARALGEDRVRRTGTESHIYRKYWTTDGAGEPVTLLVLSGGRPRDLQPHRPEVCYPAAGWTRRDHRQVNLPTPAGTALPAQLQRFVRSGLSLEQIWVLSYYIVDGECAADLAPVRARVWGPGQGVRTLTQVQVIVSADRRPEESAERALEFAAVSAEPIRRVLLAGAGGP